jgi:hypothetical protein
LRGLAPVVIGVALISIVLDSSIASGPGAQANPQESVPAQARDATPPVKPDSKKAKEAYQEGVRAEKAQDWEAAYPAYSEAVDFAPNNRDYFLRREIAKGRLVEMKADTAEKDAVSGRLEDAQKELKSALYLDPTNRVLRERLAELMAAEPGQIQEITEPEPGGQIHLQYEPGTRNFDYRGDTQGAYKEIGKQFGVEVAFDVDLRGRTIRFQAGNVDFPTATRLLGDMTGTFWRPLARHLFFVAEDTPQKRKDYDVSAVRTILLPASETPDQMTELSRVVREVTGITRTELDTGSRTLTLRAAPQALAVASDLIENLEKPTGEMVLEMEVLEVDRNFARQMGITPPQTAQVYSVSSAEIQEAEQSEEGLIDVLNQVFGTSSLSAIPPLIAFGGGETTFLATLPGASANFSQMLSLVRTGRRILLRAQDGQPATFFVGQRYPVSLSSYASSFISGSGISGPAGTSSLVNPITNYAAGNGPAAVATTSLRNNGIYDLIVANSADNDVSILLGDGEGLFSTQTTFATGTDPVSVVTGQFNANTDDFPDLAVANKSANTVSILLGNGDGTFQPKIDIPTGTAPVSVITANFHDLTNSGGVDLAVANQGSNSISIFEGNGNGTFMAPTTIQLPTGFKPASIAATELTADGHTDLVVADEGNNTVSVFLGNGDGTFQTRTDYPTGNDPIFVTFGDFTSNGALDIAVADNGAPGNGNNGNAVTVYMNQLNSQNTPTGTFVAGTTRDFAAGGGPTSIAVADYNVDGLADLAVSDEADNAVSILLNLGSGTFAPNVEVPVGTAPLSIATADFNADGRPDVATANSGSANTTVILNSASIFGSPLTSGTTPYPGIEYLDIGLKVKATPRIHPNGDVTLQLALDISSLAGESFNSIPVVNNETVEQTVRLKHNETGMLAGFLQSQVTNAINGTPGLAEVPGVGLLGSDQSAQQQDTELLILVTPRMVRLAPRTDHVIYAGQGSIEGAIGVGAGALGGIPPRPVPTPNPVEQPPQQQPAAQPPIEPTPQPPQEPTGPPAAGQPPPPEGQQANPGQPTPERPLPGPPTGPPD